MLADGRALARRDERCGFRVTVGDAAYVARSDRRGSGRVRVWRVVDALKELVKAGRVLLTRAIGSLGTVEFLENVALEPWLLLAGSAPPFGEKTGYGQTCARRSRCFYVLGSWREYLCVGVERDYPTQAIFLSSGCGRLVLKASQEGRYT